MTDKNDLDRDIIPKEELVSWELYWAQRTVAGNLHPFCMVMYHDRRDFNGEEYINYFDGVRCDDVESFDFYYHIKRPGGNIGQVYHSNPEHLYGPVTHAKIIADIEKQLMNDRLVSCEKSDVVLPLQDCINCDCSYCTATRHMMDQKLNAVNAYHKSLNQIDRLKDAVARLQMPEVINNPRGKTQSAKIDSENTEIELDKLVGKKVLIHGPFGWWVGRLLKKIGLLGIRKYYYIGHQSTGPSYVRVYISEVEKIQDDIICLNGRKARWR